MADWFDAERHAEQARRYYKSGQWRHSLRQLRQALAVDPERAEWHLGSAMALDALGRYEEAMLCYQHVLRLGAEDEPTLLGLGIDLIRTGNPKAALDTLERLAQINPDNEKAYCHRIKAYTMLGDTEQAESMFYLARQLVDECPRCYSHIAESLMDRGQTARAIWCWQQVLRLEPQNQEVRGQLARAHWRSGNPRRAYRLFIRQLRLTPGNVRTLLQVSLLLLEIGREAEAAEKLRRILELDPTSADAHAMLGELALRRGHDEAASRHFRRTLRLESQRPGVHLGLARIAQRSGDLDTARRWALAEPSNPNVALILEKARLLIELQLPDDALGLLQSLDGASGIQMPPDQQAAALLYRGVARLLLGRLRDGIRDCQRSYRIDRRQPMAIHNIILGYLDLGEMKRARLWLRKFANQYRDDAQYRVLMHQWRRRRLLMAVRRVLGWVSPWKGTRNEERGTRN